MTSPPWIQLGVCPGWHLTVRLHQSWKDEMTAGPETVESPGLKAPQWQPPENPKPRYGGT